MTGDGHPLALQNKFVVEDSLTVRFLVKWSICGGSEMNPENAIN